MKKKYLLTATALLTAVVLGACGTGAKEDNANGAASSEQTDTAATDSSTQGTASTDTASDAAATASSLELKTDTKTVLDFDLEKLVKLGDYKGLQLTTVKGEVTDEKVEETLKSNFSASPLMKDVTDRAVQKGDTVDINFEGKYADTLEAFEGGTAENYSLVIGSGSFIDGFEDGLVGVKIGETVDLNLTFPENYGAANLAGKAVVFTVKVNGLKVADTAPSDEWVASLGLSDAKNLDQYKTHLKKELQTDADEEYKAAVMNEAVEAATNNATVDEIPEQLYNRYYNVVYQSVDSYIQQIYYTYGVQTTVDEYISGLMKSNGMTGTVDDYLSDIINQQTKRSMVVQTIANKENITVSDEELDEFIRTYYDTYYSQMYSTIDEYKASLDLEEYRETVLTDKVAQFLVDNDKEATAK